MGTALYINGVFEETLEEIVAAQANLPGHVFYLQPYKAAKIKLLASANPTPSDPIPLFLSVTDSLQSVSYRARIVGWNDKQALAQDPPALAKFNEAISKYQPKEKEIFLTVGKGTPCANLIHIVDLQKVVPAQPISGFIKVSDDKSLQLRSRSGGWSYVYEPPQNFKPLQMPSLDDVLQTLQAEVQKSLDQSPAVRSQYLSVAPKLPASIQVSTRVFVRAPAVVAEVLTRANGICGRCAVKAPFIRATDGSPYLEVHHNVHLASGGYDTVENAVALCPNCHREMHHGIANT